MVTFLPVLIGFCDRNVATHNYAGTNGNESGAAQNIGGDGSGRNGDDIRRKSRWKQVHLGLLVNTM